MNLNHSIKHNLLFKILFLKDAAIFCAPLQQLHMSSFTYRTLAFLEMLIIMLAYIYLPYRKYSIDLLTLLNKRSFPRDL